MRGRWVSLALVAASLLVACTSHEAPKLVTAHGGNGTTATYAGVAITLPTSFRVVNDHPPFCGAPPGRSAFFYVAPDLSNSPGLGCPSSSPLGPYISVECHPSEPPPAGPPIKVGPFRAVAAPTPPTNRHPRWRTLFLLGRDTRIDLYGSPRWIDRVQSTIRGASGSC